MLRKYRVNSRGHMTIEIIIFGGLAVILMSGFILWTFSALNFSLRNVNKSIAFSIAEAGIEYYRWHLAHDQADYWDGQGATSTGPYIHPYHDRYGNLLGQFELQITPPPAGSTIVTIRSTGRVATDPTIEKIIVVKLGIPSLVEFGAALNSNVRFSAGTDVYGEVMSNGGVRMDGTAHNVVKSARSDYDDPDHGNQNEFGVHTHRDLPPATTVTDSFRQNEAPPTSPVPDRSDVFLAGREFPVPPLNFTGFTSDLATIKSEAQSGGLYFASSGVLGYHVVLKTNDTFDLYRVTALVPKPPSCSNTQNQNGWGIWSVQSESLIGNYGFPANNTVFLEDDVWVSGTIDTARLTIAAGQFPESSQAYRNITVNSNVRYTNYDGRDALGLIAQGNFNIGLMSEDNLRIDGALVANNGRVGRYFYRPPTSGSGGNQGCGTYNVRAVVTIFGIVVSNAPYQFSYGDGTGYQSVVIIYDANLLYAPPSNFPLVGDQYVQISWDEVR